MPAASNAEYIREKLDDIARSQQELAKAFGDFQQIYFERHQAVVAQAGRAHERIDRLDADMSELKKEMREMANLAPWVRAQAFIITGLAIPLLLGAIGFAWALITHQVKLP